MRKLNKQKIRWIVREIEKKDLSIYQIAKQQKISKVKVLDKKIRRKKWVRYERRHSNSLLHTDFCEIEGKQLISYLDDASRYVVSHGMFDEATTDNAFLVLKSGIQKHGLPKQVMTDRGSQFCSDEEKVFCFSEALKSMGIQHIMARIKQPQSNGKEERWFGTIKKLYWCMSQKRNC